MFEENNHIQPESLIRIIMERKKANYLFVSVSHTSNEKKHSKIHDHFEALQKIFHMRPCSLSYLYPFRYGIRMKTGSQELGNSVLPDFHGLSLL